MDRSYFTPRRFLALSESPRAAGCQILLLQAVALGFPKLFHGAGHALTDVVSSVDTEPGTITITNFASLT
eukprot:scaffold1238_cov19-Tisochrysis_lutea.AAC.1